ncbi:MAG: hypothetical protein AB8F95_01040 [Bacteroidia bacterium]
MKQDSLESIYEDPAWLSEEREKEGDRLTRLNWRIFLVISGISFVTVVLVLFLKDDLSSIKYVALLIPGFILAGIPVLIVSAFLAFIPYKKMSHNHKMEIIALWIMTGLVFCMDVLFFL